MNKAAVLVLLFLLGIPSGSLISRMKAPDLDKRERNHRVRIREGVKTGELTRREARKLAARERRFGAHKRMAKADGKVTRAERRHLRRELRHNGRHIYRLKHNHRRRGA